MTRALVDRSCQSRPLRLSLGLRGRKFRTGLLEFLGQRRELAGALRPPQATAAAAPPEASTHAAMGLPTCRFLLSRYGARMDIVTNPEDGTTYRIRVPLPEAQRPAPRPEPTLGPEQDLAGVYVY